MCKLEESDFGFIGCTKGGETHLKSKRKICLFLFIMNKFTDDSILELHFLILVPSPRFSLNRWNFVERNFSHILNYILFKTCLKD